MHKTVLPTGPARRRRATRAGPQRAALGALVLAVAAATLLLPSPAAAQTRVAIRGEILTQDGRPATDAEVRLVGVARRTQVDESGRFIFEALPPGEYLLEATSARFGRALERVVVEAGVTREVTISLAPLYHVDEIVATASPDPRSREELVQPTSVLSGRRLTERAAASLGETLEGEPGMSSSFFGPASSRPVIRGLGGDRVRVLESGVGVGDASNTSPDHAVSLEPATAERIEVIRGPATLLYGSSAIGGVVNVIDGRIPRELPTQPLSGFVQGQGGTAAEELHGAAGVTGTAGPIAMHLSGLRRSTEDYSVPHGALHQDEEGGAGEEEEAGVIENSALETTRYAAGASYVGSAGFIGASWSGYHTEYGVPGHAHEEPGAEPPVDGEEELVAIDLRQRRFDMEGAWRFGGRAIQSLRARFGLTDYRHTELEGAEIGTRFLNDSWETRLEARHAPVGPIEGAVGVQFGSRDFSAIGEEAFVPPSNTDHYAAFLFEEANASAAVRLQFGARFERQDVSSDAGMERDHSGVSLSTGLNWTATDQLSFAVSAGRSIKLPNAEELFSNGPHLATSSFELGDPDLDREVGYSMDATVHAHTGLVNAEVTGFVNRFEDFIFQRFNGDEVDGLPVLVYVQGDALFTGFEARGEIELLHRSPHHVALELSGDYVRAELTAPDQPLPRIPPFRYGSGVRYEGNPWRAHLGLRRTTSQGRVAPFEEPTPGYTMLGATVGFRFFAGGTLHELTLRGTNLTDEVALNHVSFLKEVAPLPGRDIRLTYRMLF